MDENIIKAIDSMILVENDLRRSLVKTTAVGSILILDYIGLAVELRRKITTYKNNVEIDEGERE